MIEKNTSLFENLLALIDKKLPFLGMNPLNTDSEKNRFFKNPENNPVFRYSKHPSGVEKLFRKIEDIELKENVINRLLLQKLEKFKKTNAMIQSIGGDEFTFFSKEIFGEPSNELVKKAYQILEHEPLKEEENITSKQVFDVMKKVVGDFQLTDWIVGLKKMPANAAVLVSKKRIFVRKNSVFPQSFLKRVVVHEIGTHVFRATNGEKQPYNIFRTGLPDYLMTEEGLAVNAEELNKCLKINTLRTYAGRVIAVHLSLQTGFRQVFEELRKYFDEYRAWGIAVRAKRGLIDTSKPGAYTKDYLYLHGYYEVKNFLEEQGSKGLRTLYYGRIGLEHAPLIKEIEGLIKPELVPVSKKFREVLKEVGA
ncbi:hypothetical protein AYK26_05325 [Euryarchaeota archaeon SM23-78]|nr:MAG: hypothetical protein AYK26_05325 [Euryarchaeota archaeon SM23-78]MBW3000967.1 DUF1704 domain-containing protein [Candidatus Woesearchaeota archaeon]